MAHPTDSLISDFVLFLHEEKLWWLTPLVACLALISMLLVAAETSAISPFIYMIF